jgi:hypothetical protein
MKLKTAKVLILNDKTEKLTDFRGFRPVKPNNLKQV